MGQPRRGRLRYGQPRMNGGRLARTSLAAAIGSLVVVLAACSGGGPSAPALDSVSAGGADAGTTGGATVIPWSGATAPPARAATPTPSPTPAVNPAVRACGSTDLDYRAITQGVSGGQLAGWVTVSNRSATDCAVAGRPLVVFFDATGATYPPDQRGADPAAGAAVLLPAGTTPLSTDGSWPGRASLQLGWSAGVDGCRLDLVKTAGARITFPDGSSLDVPEFRGSSCKGLISVSVFKPVEVPSPGVLRPSVDVTIDAPATSHAGETLSYTVSLTNKSNFSGWFNGTCPVFRADFNAEAVRLTRAKQFGAEMVLNCEGIDRIAPGQTISFEMRLDVPPDAAPGTYLIDWQAGFGSLALSSKKIEVVPK